MTPWSAWLPEIARYARTAPVPVIEHAVCRAAREFLRRTRAWIEWLEPQVTRAGPRQLYDFALPAKAELLRIERATRNGNPFDVTSYRLESVDWERNENGAQSLISGDLQTFTLTGVQGEGDVLQVQVSLLPRHDAAGVPDRIARRYLEAIAFGAKAELLMVPDTQFYRPDLAAGARADFEAAINGHAVDAFRGSTNQVPRAHVRWC
jgi:hypothetical protein